jgi:hypothetical protein
MHFNRKTSWSFYGTTKLTSLKGKPKSLYVINIWAKVREASVQKQRIISR